MYNLQNNPLRPTVQRATTRHDKFKLYPGNIWHSQVVDVEWEPLRMKNTKYDSHHCQILSDVLFTHLANPKPIWNSKEFERELERLANEGNHTRTPSWFRYGVVSVLSPEQLDSVLKKSLNGTFDYYLVLSDPAHPTAFLFVNARHQPEKTRRTLDARLGPKSRYTESMLIAPASADYGIELQGPSGPPQFREDDDCLRLLVIGNPPVDDSVRSTRIMLNFEKKWLAAWKGNPDLENQRITVVEFESQTARNRVAWAHPHLDNFFCDSIVDEQHVYEETILHIRYDVDESIIGIRLRVRDQDLRRVGHEVRLEGVRVLGDTRQRELELYDLPSDLRTREDIESFVEEICKENNIGIERMEPIWRTKINTTPPSIGQMRQQVDRFLHDVCCHDLRLLPLNDPVAHHIDLTGAPWIIHTERLEVDRFNFCVIFEDLRKGKRIIQAAMENFLRNPDIVLCVNDFQPELTPVHRAFVVVSRELRAVFNETIRKFDKKIRHLFCDLAARNRPIMSERKADLFALRVFERSTEGSHYIGVEGWEPQTVTYFLDELKELLSGAVLDGTSHPELLFGIGEKYAKSMEDEHKVLVDIDKFRSEISVFGDNAQKVIEELRTFQNSKNRIQIETAIHLEFVNYGDDEKFRKMSFWEKSGLGGNYWVLRPNQNTIEFRGTIEVLERILGALNSFSKRAMARCLDRRDGWKEVACHICLEKVEGRDWYRQTCGHVMCRDCANNQVNADFSRGKYEIACEDCGVNWTANDIIKFVRGGPNRLQILDHRKIQKMMPLLHQAVLSANNTLQPCPTPDCLGIRQVNPQGPDKDCSICKVSYCGSCLRNRESAETHQCREREPDMDAETQRFFAEHTKTCPGCGMGTEKMGGCNHIECRCGTHFCWLCEFHATTNREVYGHLQEVHGAFGDGYDMDDDDDLLDDDEEFLQEELFQILNVQ